MPSYQMHLKKETRMLGAMQIMNGVFISTLGYLWIYLYATQRHALGKDYLAVIIFSGYPFWSSMMYILSGSFSIVLEKWRFKIMKAFTIAANGLSIFFSGVGLFFLALELISYGLLVDAPNWAQKSGYMLSEYVGIFTFLQFILSTTVIHWAMRVTYTFS